MNQESETRNRWSALPALVLALACVIALGGCTFDCYEETDSIDEPNCDCSQCIIPLGVCADWNEPPLPNGECRDPSPLVLNEGRASRPDPALADMAGEIQSLVRSNPALFIEAAPVAAAWASVAASGNLPDSGSHLITPEMTMKADRFADSLVAAAEPELALRLRALRAAVEPDSLVGLTGREALDRVGAVAKSTKILDAGPSSLDAGQRGLAIAGQAVVIPATAKVAGAAGTSWRTDVMVVNPGTIDAAYEVALLVRGEDNSDPVTTVRYLAPGEGEFLGDVLDGLFSTDGAAALRIVAGAGAVAVTSRTYNLLGDGNPLGLPEGASFGQFIPAVTVDDAIRLADAGDSSSVMTRPPRLPHQPEPGQRGRRRHHRRDRP